MNREILFRARRIDNGEWIIAKLDLLYSEEACMPGTIVWRCAKSKLSSDYYEIDPNTICEYTGQKDKNGTKIFEGDVLSVFDPMDNSKFVGSVSFQDGSFIIDDGTMKHYRWIDYIVDVIGNIHENPELQK